MSLLRQIVPCGNCRACCSHEAIVLHPQHGDDIGSYETMDAVHPLTLEPVKALKQKPNGECVYLGAEGCTIHERAPVICREFSCVGLWLSLMEMSRNDRRRARRVLGGPVLEAGKARARKTR